MRDPPHMRPWEKVSKSKRVTMPKLLPPPRRAKKRSGYDV